MHALSQSVFLPHKYLEDHCHLIRILHEFLFHPHSVNMDVIIEVDRLPRRDETVASRAPAGVQYVPGGKGANQAAALALLSQGTGISVRLACQFGQDSHAAVLEAAMVSCGVDVSAATRCACQSGQGYVFLEPDGAASSVVVGGANAAWPASLSEGLRSLLRGARAVLLQREVPEYINEAASSEAAAAGVPVFQDVGGEDRPLSDAQLRRATYLMPNQSELERLTGLPAATPAKAATAAAALQARGARSVLVTLGAGGSLLLDEEGRLTFQPAADVPGGVVADATAAGDAYRAAFALGVVEARPVSECLRFATAAGAIAVSRVGAVPSLPRRAECEQLCASTPPAEAMTGAREVASPGTPATTGLRGGVAEAPGTPASNPRAATADELSRASLDGRTAAAAAVPHPTPPIRARGGAQAGGLQCPLGFASRLNSMKDGWRKEWGLPNDILGWVAAQGRVRGLSLVDFNYPQHLAGVDLARVRNATSKIDRPLRLPHSPPNPPNKVQPSAGSPLLPPPLLLQALCLTELNPPTPHRRLQVKHALVSSNLRAGAICMRYTKEHQRGGFTNPDPELRRRAIQMTLDGCSVARELGAAEVVVWSAYDGQRHATTTYAAIQDASVKRGLQKEKVSGLPREKAPQKHCTIRRSFTRKCRLLARAQHPAHSLAPS
jgi:ribokinase